MGHFSYDIYSYIYIELYPCRNTTSNGDKCKPQEIIDSIIKGTYLCMEFEDVELTPHNYSIPVLPRNQDIYFKIGKKQLQDVHIFYQIVNIETDIEYIGLDEFPRLRNNEYLKYHSVSQMPVVLDLKENDPFCVITIKLYDQIRTQRRTYTKLLQLWGDVGGVMEFISMILTWFASFPIDFLYKMTIANDVLDSEVNKVSYKKKEYQIEKIIHNPPKKKKTLRIDSYGLVHDKKTDKILLKKEKEIDQNKNFIKSNTYTPPKKQKSILEKLKCNLKSCFCFCCYGRCCDKTGHNFSVIEKKMQKFSDKMDIIKMYRNFEKISLIMDKISIDDISFILKKFSLINLELSTQCDGRFEKIIPNNNIHG
jgi:hypothetical protein